MKTQFTFSNKQKAEQNLSRLLTILEHKGHRVEEVDTLCDFCVAYVDGIEFSCDWKHNSFKDWEDNLTYLGFNVIKCSEAELIIEIELNLVPSMNQSEKGVRHEHDNKT